MGNQTYENKFKMDEIKDKVVILLGKTGDGKSSFINSITKKNECKVGCTTDACTHKLQQVDVANNGYNYYFVDTPGLDDGKGDQQNILQLENLKQKYPRINVFIICLKFNDIRLSLSLKNALIKFMEIFPTPSFWDHVLILRTHSERSKKFEKNKKKIEGQLIEGICKDKDLIEFMEKNCINIPTGLKEFFVDCDSDGLDEETENEFQIIFDEIKKIYPIYKEIEEEIKENVNEEKDKNFTFIHIKTQKIIKFKDFDNKEHEVIQDVSDEKYNLDGIKPIITEVKREQEKLPRGPLCWKNQYKTHYYLVKYYEIGGNRKRVESYIEYRWEYKIIEAEIQGEAYREKLNEFYKGENGIGCG
jgi:hypothetical protein